jgi:uncharacterized protein YkwD
MQRLAQEHSNSMAQRNSRDHVGFEERARKGQSGERRLRGHAKAEAMAMWAASPSHASNMILPGCKAVASATSRGHALLDDGNRQDDARPLTALLPEARAPQSLP